MHPALKKAWYEAGVKVFRFNYPADPKERGAKQLSALGDNIDAALYDRDGAIATRDKTIAKLSSDLADLREHLDKIKTESVLRGAKHWAAKNQLSEDREQMLIESVGRN